MDRAEVEAIYDVVGRCVELISSWADGLSSAGSAAQAGRFGRHQVVALLPIGVIVTEHRAHRLRCRHCCAGISAMLPSEIGRSAFWARLQAAVVTLSARHRISRRGITELARDLFGVTLSAGTVDAVCQRASDALAGRHLHLQDCVLDENAVHVDEPGLPTSGEGRALGPRPPSRCVQIAKDHPAERAPLPDHPPRTLAQHPKRNGERSSKRALSVAANLQTPKPLAVDLSHRTGASHTASTHSPALI